MSINNFFVVSECAVLILENNGQFRNIGDRHLRIAPLLDVIGCGVAPDGQSWPTVREPLVLKIEPITQ
jgi:hypothetical protein